jgi:hypothetical protein
MGQAMFLPSLCFEIVSHLIAIMTRGFRAVEDIRKSTYSSLTQLPTEIPPQLIPFMKLPAVLLSLRLRSLTNIGFAPVPL